MSLKGGYVPALQVENLRQDQLAHDKDDYQWLVS